MFINWHLNCQRLNLIIIQLASNSNLTTMNSQNNSQGQETNPVQELSFEELSQVTDLQNSGNLIETYIKGHNWSDSYNCIT